MSSVGGKRCSERRGGGGGVLGEKWQKMFRQSVRECPDLDTGLRCLSSASSNENHEERGAHCLSARLSRERGVRRAKSRLNTATSWREVEHG